MPWATSKKNNLGESKVNIGIWFRNLFYYYAVDVVVVYEWNKNMTANGYKCCVTPIGRKEKSTCHISFFLPLWECCGGRRVLGINILIARDSPSNDGAILFSKSWGEKGGGICHLVFCLSFLAFAPRMIPFRHTRQRSLKRRTKNKYTCTRHVKLSEVL